MNRLIWLFLAAIAITGCVGEDSENNDEAPLVIGGPDTDVPDEGTPDDNAPEDKDYLFIAQLKAADYSSSEIAVGVVGTTTVVEGYATSDDSDYTIDVYGQYLYHIGKYNIDTLTRYDSEAHFLQADYTYSLAEPESDTTNAYQIIQVADDKAYVIRYGKTSIQIVDPSADEANFVTGEIDMSAYTVEGATYPRMASGVVVDDKLFVGMQRLDSSWQPTQSYVAVIDIETNTEIDTSSEEGLKGIAVNADNLFSLTTDGNHVYVAGRGNYGDNSGALDRINIDNYTVENIINGTTFPGLNDVSEDGNASNDTYYHVLGAAIVGDTAFVKLNLEQGYTSLSSAIYSFPVSDSDNFTAVTPDVLSDEKIGILKAGPDETLWVGIDSAEAPDVIILNEEGEVQGEALEFSMPVVDLEFMETRN